MMQIFSKITSFKLDYKINAFPQKSDLLFLFDSTNHHLFYSNGTLAIEDIINDQAIFQPKDLVCFGTIDSKNCFCLKKETMSSGEITALDKILLKTSYLQLTEEEYQAALFANHLTYWLTRHTYCGKCTAENKLCSEELALQCSSCKQITYPVISPCVIGLIHRDKEILLAQSKQSAPNTYGCISGFVNPGENLESALKREVLEETSIKISNIRYVTSQHWPFPNSLMIGFMAEYLSGEIDIDKNELVDADWYSLDNLPELPNSISISRYLIDDYCKIYNLSKK